MCQPELNRPASLTFRAMLCSLACALAVAGPVRAQSELYADGDDTGMAQAEPRPASNRSLFVGTLVALIAQGIGHGVGNALSKGMGGSITRWFHSTPAGAERPTQNVSQKHRSPKQLDSTGPQVKAEPVKAHAGIAYEIHAIDRRGVAKAVDATTHQFHTGDLFRIYYRPTLPGRIRVSNVDPTGATALVDRVEVAAGQLVQLGPYEFVGRKGRETVRLLLEPCESALLMASTRAIVKRPASEFGPAVGGLKMRGCDRGAGADQKDPLTRAIRKSTTEGSTVYALDRVAARELTSGNYDARAVDITLWHR